MKIIIEVKDTATLSRIDEFDKELQQAIYAEYVDIIESISKEW